MRRIPRPRTLSPPPPVPDPYRDLWLRLSPGERLRRSWRLRSRIPDLQAAHDAKTFRKL
ncbi:MAG TPA: hypothetical protein VNO22_01295 [Planctomycetota bacterium]|nr:hypothetical protein [Planctomycetota bacterium]